MKNKVMNQHKSKRKKKSFKIKRKANKRLKKESKKPVALDYYAADYM